MISDDPHGDINVDLSGIGQRNRGLAWRQWSDSAFHNIDLVDVHSGLLEGSIRGFELGERRLFRIVSAGRTIVRKDKPLEEPFVTLLVQLSGTTQITRGDQQQSLATGDIGLIDGASEFRQSHSPASEFLLFQTRRSLALAKSPGMVLSPVNIYPGELAASRMVLDALKAAFAAVGQLSADQRNLLGQALFDLSGMLPLEIDDGLGHSRARRREALILIEDELANRSLTPEAVARYVGLSRRRLDELLMLHVGKTIAGYIWERRLLRAGDLLRQASLRQHTIAELAFSAGFEDCSHFSKAFRNRFGMTPRQWRAGETGREWVSTARAKSPDGAA